MVKCDLTLRSEDMSLPRQLGIFINVLVFLGTSEMLSYAEEKRTPLRTSNANKAPRQTAQRK